MDGETFIWWTHEGVAAFEDALETLKNVHAGNPVPQLHWDDGLALAARDHCLDMGPGGYISNTGTDGSTTEQRALRYGSASNSPDNFEENFTFGLPRFAPELIVLSMYVDDGMCPQDEP